MARKKRESISGSGNYGAEKKRRKSSRESASASHEIVTWNEVVELKPRLKLVNGVTMIIGSVISSGIFTSPGAIQKEVGSLGVSLIVWLSCGAFSAIGAHCYAELGTMIPKSGGDYIYLYEAFGPAVAFMRLWTDAVIIRPIYAAVISIKCAEYVIDPIYPTCDKPAILVRLIAAVVVCKYHRFIGNTTRLTRL